MWAGLEDNEVVNASRNTSKWYVVWTGLEDCEVADDSRNNVEWCGLGQRAMKWLRLVGTL